MPHHGGWFLRPGGYICHHIPVLAAGQSPGQAGPISIGLGFLATHLDGKGAPSLTCDTEQGQAVPRPGIPCGPLRAGPRGHHEESSSSNKGFILAHIAAAEGSGGPELSYPSMLTWSGQTLGSLLLMASCVFSARWPYPGALLPPLWRAVVVASWGPRTAPCGCVVLQGRWHPGIHAGPMCVAPVFESKWVGCAQIGPPGFGRVLLLVATRWRSRPSDSHSRLFLLLPLSLFWAASPGSLCTFPVFRTCPSEKKRARKSS